MKYKSDKIYRLLFDHIGLERGDELTTKMVEEHLSEFTRASDDLKRIKAENKRLRHGVRMVWTEARHFDEGADCEFDGGEALNSMPRIVEYVREAMPEVEEVSNGN